MVLVLGYYSVYESCINVKYLDKSIKLNLLENVMFEW